MNKTLEEITASADAAYHGREQLEGVRRSLHLLQLAPGDYEALWRLGRAHFFLGQEATRDSEACANYVAGTRACRRARRILPERVEGHFWLGVNLALLAGLENPFRALPLALRAKRALRRAVGLDAAYHAAGPLRVLARLESRLPRFFGGGDQRARAHFQQAIRLAPANTVTRLYFAELLMNAGHYPDARAELEAVLGAPADPAWAFEIRRDKAKAQKLLAKTKEPQGI